MLLERNAPQHAHTRAKRETREREKRKREKEERHEREPGVINKPKRANTRQTHINTIEKSWAESNWDAEKI
jgi:hypothetical protein